MDQYLARVTHRHARDIPHIDGYAYALSRMQLFHIYNFQDIAAIQESHAEYLLKSRQFLACSSDACLHSLVTINYNVEMIRPEITPPDDIRSFS